MGLITKEQAESIIAELEKHVLAANTAWYPQNVRRIIRNCVYAPPAWFINFCETEKIKAIQEHPSDWRTRMDERIKCLEIKLDGLTDSIYYGVEK